MSWRDWLFRLRRCIAWVKSLPNRKLNDAICRWYKWRGFNLRVCENGGGYCWRREQQP